MNFNKPLLVASLICSITQVALAEIKISKCIGNIAEVTDNLPQGDNIIAILDWDQTISAKEGEYTPRETGPKGTLESIKKLSEAGIKMIIMTARGGGYVYPEKDLDPFINKMLETMGSENWLAHGALKDKSYKTLPVKRRLHLLAKNQIVFAGGDVKGEALAKLIDGNMFYQKPTKIIFVDNADYNIRNMEAVFKNRQEEAYIFHYPNPPEDRPCSK
ncbi:MAG: DUF2608 domain-containing protein [Pseudomonadota bacterium]